MLGFGARLPPDGVVAHEFALVCIISNYKVIVYYKICPGNECIFVKLLNLKNL